jgi:hypothetical protein
MITLILSACGHDRQTSDNKISTFYTQTHEIIDIIGKWAISKTISRTLDSEVEVLCNACPTITFDTNNAILTFPNSRTENYSWSIAADTLTLLGTYETTSSTLPFFLNFKYKIEYKQKEEYLELRLTADDHLTYVLRRKQ